MKLKALFNPVLSHLKHWEYGFIEGFIIGLILLSFSDNSMFTVILLSPLILAIILIGGRVLYPFFRDINFERELKIPYTPPESSTKKTVSHGNGRPCPECGSTRRHKKGCIYGKGGMLSEEVMKKARKFNR